MKRIIKIIVIISILLSFTILFNYTYATDEVMEGAESFLEIGESQDQILDMGKIKEASDSIYNVFTAIGSVIVVIVGAVLGVMFMLGSIEEKVKVQEALVPYVIGTIIIFGAVGIWTIVRAISEGAFSNI